MATLGITRAARTLEHTESAHYAGTHHARFIDPTVPLHVISRVLQGRHLLRPSPELNTLIAGVIGRAQHLYANVRLYAFAFMSNHVHLMLQGPPDQVPSFVGFIKREISRRWGGRPEINWPGPMWHEYIATALPTDESQVRCLKYILSQGVKEGLVARAEDWPGVHCARPLLQQRSLKGRWLDATSYSRALNAESRKRKPKRIDKAPYLTEYEVAITTIPAWAGLTDAQRIRGIKRMIDEIEAEGDALRRGARPLGARRVRATSLEHRTSLPPLPWFEHRRRMICWAAPQASATREYLRRYWAFQQSFREASGARRGWGDYPSGAFAPGRIRLAA